MRLTATLAALIFSLAIAPALAQDEAPGRPAFSPAPPIARERTLPTKHTIQLGGAPLAYTATPGTLTVRDDADNPIGSFFYVAYTKDDVEKSARPITFVYNGGPGSSSLWLHMGSIGPRRLNVADAVTPPPAPYRISDNPSTLLDRSDLVFIDAMQTGYSRIGGHGTPKQFFGIDEDAAAFAKFVRRYLGANDRWQSPKFLFGESYGTTRSAALAAVLQSQGVALNGVTLLSSVLDFNTLSPGPGGEDLAYIGFFPTYAASAWYHKRVPNRPTDLAAFVQTARDFASGPYASALIRETGLSAAERMSIAARMHELIGLDTKYILAANLRISPGRFEKELLRDRARTVGRLDSRYLGIDRDAAGESPEYDATDSAITSAYTATFNAYIHDELKWQSDTEYLPTNYSVVNANWNFQRGRSRGAPNVAGDLREAMTRNPHLHLFSANGYYDLATPFFATQYTLGHLGLDSSLQANVRYGFYAAGHMIYMNPTELAAFKRDLSSFYDESLAR